MDKQTMNYDAVYITQWIQ